MINNEEGDQNRFTPIADINDHEYNKADVEIDDDKGDDKQEAVGKFSPEELL